MLKWKPLTWAEERGQIAAGVGPFLERRMSERRAFVARESFPSRHDKAVRAQSIRGRMAIEGLYLPEHAPWLEPLRSELLMFPASATDDAVDALSLVGQMLDQIVLGQRPKPLELSKPKPRYTALERGRHSCKTL